MVQLIMRVCLCAGAVCGDSDFIRSLVDLQVGPIMLTGPTMDAKVASELSLRLAHLGIRMAEHSRRALAYAQRLQQVPRKLCPRTGLPPTIHSTCLQQACAVLARQASGGSVVCAPGGRAVDYGGVSRLSDRGFFVCGLWHMPSDVAPAR